MKILITGMNGTVAPAVGHELHAAGHTFVPWNRSVVPTDTRAAVSSFLLKEKPDWFFHIATGSPVWAQWIAECCAELNVKLLFASSVSVYGADQTGPFTIDSIPVPTDDYGRYKLECEERVRVALPDAFIVRLGWQIGPGKNQMVNYLHGLFRDQGRIDASIHQYPACSFLSDTARSMLWLVQTMDPGIYLLDGNPGMSFYEIAVALNRVMWHPWVVNPAISPILNNLMRDYRVNVPRIDESFRIRRQSPMASA